MKLRLAFAAITVATLALVGCQPQEEPSDPLGGVAECYGDDDASLARLETCVWHADRHGNGSGLSFFSYHHGRVLTYWDAEDYAEYDNR